MIRHTKNNRGITMRTINLLTIFMLSFFLFYYSIHASVDEQSNDIILRVDKTLFDEIRDLAAQMEVFPVHLFATRMDGPLGYRTILHKQMDAKAFISSFRSSYLGEFRFVGCELTFDRFVPVFEFKEVVYKARVKDVEDCIDRINEMTPKEKALLLMTIYIFEYRYRYHPKSDYFTKYHQHQGKEIRYAGMIIGYKPDESLDNNIWSKWLAIIEKYKDDTTVAFTAIDVPLEELMKDWEAGYKKCKEALTTRWHLPSEWGVITATEEFRSLLATLKESSPQEARQLSMHGEYCVIFDDGNLPFANHSGSMFPKTLGDIATQILMSRCKYDPDHPNAKD